MEIRLGETNHRLGVNRTKSYNENHVNISITPDAIHYIDRKFHERSHTCGRMERSDNFPLNRLTTIYSTRVEILAILRDVYKSNSSPSLQLGTMRTEMRTAEYFFQNNSGPMETIVEIYLRCASDAI